MYLSFSNLAVCSVAFIGVACFYLNESVSLNKGGSILGRLPYHGHCPSQPGLYFCRA